MSGTPASLSARFPPQTDAMELDPLLSVMVLSTLMVYGKSSCSGMTGSRALSASSPWPSSLLPGAPTLPVSPTEDGGKKYWR